MKKSIKFSLLAAVIAFGMVSCDDDDDNNDEPLTNEEMIVGTWVGESATYYEYDQANEDTLVSEPAFGADFSYSADFNEDGTFTMYSDDTLSGDYTLEGTMLTQMDEEGDTTVAEIIELTETDFRFKREEADSVGTYGFMFDMMKN